MTTTPTDRGIAFIRTNSDGTKNVYVATGVGASNAPEDVFAMHLNRPNVDLDPAVGTVEAGALVRTTEAVQVSSRTNEVVHVRPRRSDLGPLLK